MREIKQEMDFEELPSDDQLNRLGKNALQSFSNSFGLELTVFLTILVQEKAIIYHFFVSDLKNNGTLNYELHYEGCLSLDRSSKESYCVMWSYLNNKRHNLDDQYRLPTPYTLNYSLIDDKWAYTGRHRDSFTGFDIPAYEEPRISLYSTHQLSYHYEKGDRFGERDDSIKGPSFIISPEIPAGSRPSAG